MRHTSSSSHSNHKWLASKSSDSLNGGVGDHWKRKGKTTFATIYRRELIRVTDQQVVP